MSSSGFYTPLGLIGDPVEHSLSPEIFSFLSRRLDVPVSYKKFRVPRSDLENNLRSMKLERSFVGLNVTLPHKEDVVQWMDQLSPESQVVRSVNVIHQRQGHLFGFNTDIFGILQTLKERKTIVERQTAVILGAGGAAVSVGYVLGEMNAQRVWIVNRTQDKAVLLANRLSHYFPKTEFKAASLDSGIYLSEQVSTCIHVTPLGMEGFPSMDLPLPNALNSASLAFDLIYRPEMTSFLKAALQKGFQVQGGLDMLIWQALAAWEIWIGKLPNRLELKAELKLYLKDYL